MRFEFAHKLVAYLFAGLGLIALMLGASFGPVDSLLVTIGFAVSWFAEPPLIDRPGYSRSWNVAAVLLLLVQIARAITGEATLTVGVQYAAFLQISRLCHRKTAADYQQIAILAFLHLIAGTVLSSGLEYGVVFFGFVIVMPWMLTLTHLRKELEAQHPMGSSTLRAELDSHELTSSSFFGGTTLLAVPLFVLTAAMFFAFPRVGFGFLSNLGARTTAVAGFGDDVELGGFGTIRDDPTVVMRVKVKGRPEPPPRSIGIRLRGTSFDKYQGGRWSRSKFENDHVRHIEDLYILVRAPRPSDREYEIILDPMEEAVLFIPEGTVAIRVPPQMRAGRARYREVVYEPGFDIRYRGRVEGPLTYKALVGPETESLSEPMSEALLERYLEVPERYQRVEALAKQVVGDVSDPKTQAERVQWYLRSGGDYAYTLDQPNTEGKDPLNVFLFEARAGHCEYFSTAMALMMRTLGVPARNVTGFLGADYNPYGDYYAVRNGNAHSWVEVFVDGQWITFDPTPASRQVFSSPLGFATKLRQILDAMRVQWAEYVVEYNIRDQARALQGLLRWYRSFGSRDRSKNARTGLSNEPGLGDIPFKPDWRWFLGIMGVFGVGVLFARWRRKQKRQSRAGRRLDPDRDRAVRLYLSLETTLRKAGRARPADVTPREHASELDRSGFVGANEVREVTDAYLATRFGDRPLSLAEYQRLRHLSRRVRRREGRTPTV